MGYHFGNTNLFDSTVDLLQPEVVIYEPQAGGHMRLVGMEYIVPLAAWEAAGHDLNNATDVPQLLGQNYTRHSLPADFQAAHLAVGEQPVRHVRGLESKGLMPV